MVETDFQIKIRAKNQPQKAGSTDTIRLIVIKQQHFRF
ncbi:Unknown protein sequence [Pseudomonas syringae pv. maculicola]|nr:Unknown protein sequence [Pseudomonas syringae pv. maculicola]